MPYGAQESAGLRRITTPGATRALYTAECGLCPAEFTDDESPEAVAEWAVEHQRARPAHRQFTWVERTFWDVAPSGGSASRPEGGERPGV